MPPGTVTTATFGDIFWNADVTTTASTGTVRWERWTATVTVGNTYGSSTTVEFRTPVAPLVATLKRRRERLRSEERAQELLRFVLSDEEWNDWRRYGSVRVIGSDDMLYEIGPGWQGMLVQLDPQSEEPLLKLCIHPSERYPVGDRVAALVLSLRANAPGVVVRANQHQWWKHEKDRVRKRRFKLHRHAAA